MIPISTKNYDNEVKIKAKTNIAELFANARSEKTFLKISAPMVRYSKVEFRTLIRRYGVDLCFTPMIMADSFCQSYKARSSEFASSTKDTPVIAQFAAKNSNDYWSAAEMVYPYVDGIDLNCGCPQRWAMSTGYGSAMLNDPQLIKDLTSTIRRNMPNNFSVSVKLRIQKPLHQTIDLCRQLEHCGVTFLTVHGRTPYQKISEPSNEDALAEIKKSIAIPLIANGDVKTLEGANALYERIGCDGVMSARAILSNPGLFAGYNATPIECVQDWVNLVVAVGDAITFQCFHHHLTFMMEKMMQRGTRVQFNNFTTKEEVLVFLEQHFGIVPQLDAELDAGTPDIGQLIRGDFDETNYKARLKNYELEEEEKRIQLERQLYDSTATDGKYFKSQMDSNCDNGLDFMESSLFDT